jgi:hypothetical protein
MNKQEMPPATFDIETWFHATHTKSSNGRVPGRTIQYEDMLNIFLYSKMEEMPDGSLDVPGMRCNIPSRDVSKYSVRGIWDSSDFTPVERELAWRQECAKSDNNLVGAVSELELLEPWQRRILRESKQTVEDAKEFLRNEAGDSDSESDRLAMSLRLARCQNGEVKRVGNRNVKNYEYTDG